MKQHLFYHYISENLKNVVSRSNLLLLDTMMELAAAFKSGKFVSVRHKALTGYRETIKNNHDQFRKQIFDLIDNIYSLSEHQMFLQLK